MNRTEEKQTIGASVSRLEAQTTELQQLYAEVEAMARTEQLPSQTSWIPFAAIAVVAASFGLFAGTALSGGLF